MWSCSRPAWSAAKDARRKPPGAWIGWPARRGRTAHCCRLAWPSANWPRCIWSRAASARRWRPCNKPWRAQSAEPCCRSTNCSCSSRNGCANSCSASLPVPAPSACARCCRSRPPSPRAVRARCSAGANWRCWSWRRAPHPGGGAGQAHGVVALGAPPHVPGVLAQGFQRRRSRALPTTLTLEKAIAAPATIGLSRPKAASGMPITL